MKKTETDAEEGQVDNRLLATPFADLLEEANQVNLGNHPSPNLGEEDDIPEYFELAEEFVIPHELRRALVVLETKFRSLSGLREQMSELLGDAQVDSDLSDETRLELIKLKEEYEELNSPITDARDFVYSLIVQVNPRIPKNKQFAVGPDWGIYTWPVQKCCGERHEPKEMAIARAMANILGGIVGSPIQVSVEDITEEDCSGESGLSGGNFGGLGDLDFGGFAINENDPRDNQ